MGGFTSAIRKVGQTRHHLHKAVEVIQICRVVQQRLDALAPTEARPSEEQIHIDLIIQAAEEALTRLHQIRDSSKAGPIFKEFCNTVSANLDGRAPDVLAKFQKKWEEAAERDKSRETIMDRVLARLEENDKNPHMKIPVSFLTRGGFFPVRERSKYFPHMSTVIVECYAKDTIAGMLWLFMYERIYKTRATATILPIPHFYTNVPDVLSRLILEDRPTSIEPVSPGTTVTEIGGKVFLLWNNELPLHIEIALPRRRVYMNIWLLDHENSSSEDLFLLKEQEKGHLELSKTAIRIPESPETAFLPSYTMSRSREPNMSLTESSLNNLLRHWKQWLREHYGDDDENHAGQKMRNSAGALGSRTPRGGEIWELKVADISRTCSPRPPEVRNGRDAPEQSQPPILSTPPSPFAPSPSADFVATPPPPSPSFPIAVVQPEAQRLATATQHQPSVSPIGKQVVPPRRAPQRNDVDSGSEEGDEPRVDQQPPDKKFRKKKRGFFKKIVDKAKKTLGMTVHIKYEEVPA